jgi:tetratricopeptide (TPR) repeat protein
MNNVIKYRKNHTGKGVYCILIVLFITSISWAQTIEEQAQKYLLNQEWNKAITSLELIVKNNPGDGQAWSRLGYSYYNLKKYDRAIIYYQKADSLEYALPQTRYNIACSYALAGKPENALRYLNEAVNAGFRQVQLISNDTDLKILRNDPRYQELILMLEQETYPCQHNPQYKAFDFWIGEWEVFNQRGQKVGENSIRKIMKDCIIIENWQSARGSKGQSINYLDPSSSEWKQTWIDEGGQIIRYSGQVIDGSMYFNGEFIDKDGNRELARVVLEPLSNGNVHHVIEHSKDYGKSWYTWFDGVYVKKKS